MKLQTSLTAEQSPNRPEFLGRGALDVSVSWEGKGIL